MKDQWIATKSGLAIEIGLVQNRPASQHFAISFVKQWSKVIPFILTEFNKRKQLNITNFARPLAYHKTLMSLTKQIHDSGTIPTYNTQSPAAYRKLDNGAAGDVFHYIVQNLFNRVTLDVCCQSNAVRMNFDANVSFDPGDTFDPDHTTPVGAKKIDEYVFKQWLKNDNLYQPLKARKK